MITAKYFWQKNINNGTRVAFQLDSYLDLKTKDLSYSYGFFLAAEFGFFAEEV